MNRESRNPVINRHSVFTLETLRPVLGLSKACLPREIRLGRLRAAKRAGRYFILGAWVLEWLEAGEVRKGRHLDDLIDYDQSSRLGKAGSRNVRVAVELRLDLNGRKLLPVQFTQDLNLPPGAGKQTE